MESWPPSSKVKRYSQKSRGGRGPRRSRSAPRVVIVLRVAQFGTCHDPKAQIGPVPPLLAQEEPKDGQTPEPGHVQEPAGRSKARACRAILQAQRLRKMSSVSV